MNRYTQRIFGFTLVVLLALVTSGETAVTAQTADKERYKVLVANVEDCPIQIVERKARVSNTLVRYPWTALSGKDPRDDQRREFGSGESQLVYDIVFKNADRQPATGIAFQWEALDREGNSLFKRLDTWNTEPVTPGRYGAVHEIDTSPSSRIASYRLSVLRVHMADGSVWAPAARSDQ